MSLPKYVVNWEELLSIIGDKLEINIDNIGLGDFEENLEGKLSVIIDLLKKILSLLYNKGVQCITPLRQHIPAVVGVYKLTKTFDVDIMLTGITYSQTGWKYQDSWDLEVDGTLLFEVFTKELGESKVFNVFYYVPAGTPINIFYHNDSGNSKIVWFDIEYLNLALTNTIPKPPTPEPEEPLPIDNPYNWKFVLRWEDSTGTDIDFHMYLNNDENSHIWYRNKQLFQDDDNQAYLNYDFTGHDEDGREKQPEILTVYGYKQSVINLFITNYNEGTIREKVTVEIFKKKQSGDELIELIEIHPNQISDTKSLYIGYVKNDIFTPDVKEVPYHPNEMDTSYCQV